MIMLIITVCVFGCTAARRKTDVWDGSIAENFAGGRGTAAEPYKISTCAQLALLAERVNSGADYSDKYFSLECGLDLNNIEWTPIGNENSPFGGSFDGNGHTVSNLRITDVGSHQRGNMSYGSAGLFGVCRGASICELSIMGAAISTDRACEFDTLRIGILAGCFQADRDCGISGINISNASILTIGRDHSAGGGTCMYLGGIAGQIYVEGAVCRMDNLQAEVVIDSSEGLCRLNFIGGITGCLTNIGSYSCSDFADYLTVYLQDEVGENKAGAFGLLVLGTGSARSELRNGYSEVRVNRTQSDDSGFCLYDVGAIAGEVRRDSRGGDNPVNLYIFENLFGCVKPTDSGADFSGNILRLYTLSDFLIYSEKNCHASAALPDNSGFDPEIWAVSYGGRPYLK